MFDPKPLITFLTNLSQNNTPQWFENHRTQYQSLRESLLHFSAPILESLSQIDQDLIHMNPKNALHHINRDIRFTKDKTPYKNYWGFRFSNTGRKKKIAGYSTIFTASGDLYIGGGQADMTTEQLNVVRDNIIKPSSSFRDILNTKKIRKNFVFREGKRLKSCPSGYDKTSPHIELLRHKEWYLLHPPIPWKQWHTWSEKKLQEYILERFSELTPFVQAINTLCLPK